MVLLILDEKCLVLQPRKFFLEL